MERPAAEVKAQPQVAWETKLQEHDLQCPICIEFFCSPLTLRCGHTFCRLCLLQSTRLAPDGRHCPTCRAPIEIKDPLNEPTDSGIEARLCTAVPLEALETRRAADAEALAAFEDRERRRIPVFCMRGVASRPNQQVRLHFFEPRYKVLIRRAWEGNRRFLCAQQPPTEGDEVLLVEVDAAHFLPDGRANIRGVGRELVQVRRAWVEEGTDGLYYAEVDGVGKGGASAAPRQGSEEARVLQSLRAAIAVGAPQYNLGRVAACTSIYAEAAESALQALDDEGHIASRLRAGYEDARRARGRRDEDGAAWALRRAFDDALAMPSARAPRSVGGGSSGSPQCCSLQ